MITFSCASRLRAWSLSLLLFSAPAGAAPILEEPAESPAAVERVSGLSLEHFLASGQTMASVARLYGLPMSAVLGANPGLEPTHLFVGQIVRVPEPADGWPLQTLGSSDTASGLVAAGGYSREALAALNPGVDLERLSPGQTLRVPRVGGAGAAAPAVASTPVVTTAETAPPAALPVTGWELVTLADGRKAWAPRSQMMVAASAPLSRAALIDLAHRFVGAPYVWGGQTPNGVDCSGYVQEVYRLGGHPLPRLADEQFERCLPVDTPQPGDLVFFSTYLPGPSHVGISLGGDRFVHASSSRGVIEASLEDAYFKSRYLGARRPPTLDAPSAAIRP